MKNAPTLPQAMERDLQAGSFLSYRREIDGLRALAILLVIGFHAYSSIVSGGFVGVDVFFVISGYLISRIIFNDIQNGSFSFIKFYQKRINRIFPALIVMFIACLAAGFTWLTPKEFIELARHIVGGAGFFSNILLWKEAGYFDSAAEAKPLLHLWSLGIEEQFYIIWPLIIFLVYRYAKNALLPIIVGLLVISFGSNIGLIAKHALATFYLPGTRFWELLIGSCLAWSQYSPYSSHFPGNTVVAPRQKTISGNIKFFIGILLILWSAFALTKVAVFPGWWALAPTAGSVLIISAGADTWGNKAILGNKWIVLIGKISFPLYLWHWPLLTFSKILNLNPATSIPISLLLAFTLSFLTYRYIEIPLRKGGRRGIAVMLCFAMLLTAGMGVFVLKKSGVPSRFQDLEIIDAHSPTTWRQIDCFIDGMTSTKFSSQCIDPVKSQRAPLIFLWGDSHAAHLYPGFHELQKEGLDFRIGQFSTSSCPPLLNFNPANRELCRRINDEIFEKIKSNRPDTILLAADWMDTTYEVDRLQDTVAQLKALNIQDIWLIGTVPRWPQPLPRYLLNVVRTSPDHSIPERAMPLDSTARDEQLKNMASTLGIHYFSPKEALCDARGCMTVVLDKNKIREIVNFDNSHLTDDGAVPVAKYLASKLSLQNNKLD